MTLFSLFLFYSRSLADPSVASMRSEVQEFAITIGLLMFGIILERFIEVLKETLNDGKSKSAAVLILSETRTSVDSK